MGHSTQTWKSWSAQLPASSQASVNKEHIVAVDSAQVLLRPLTESPYTVGWTRRFVHNLATLLKAYFPLKATLDEPSAARHCVHTWAPCCALRLGLHKISSARLALGHELRLGALRELLSIVAFRIPLIEQWCFGSSLFALLRPRLETCNFH